MRWPVRPRPNWSEAGRGRTRGVATLLRQTADPTRGALPSPKCTEIDRPFMMASRALVVIHRTAHLGPAWVVRRVRNLGVLAWVRIRPASVRAPPADSHQAGDSD